MSIKDAVVWAIEYQTKPADKYCMNKSCNYLLCKRNPKRANQNEALDYGFFEGTHHCAFSKK